MVEFCPACREIFNIEDNITDVLDDDLNIEGKYLRRAVTLACPRCKTELQATVVYQVLPYEVLNLKPI